MITSRVYRDLLRKKRGMNIEAWCCKGCLHRKWNIITKRCNNSNVIWRPLRHGHLTQRQPVIISYADVFLAVHSSFLDSFWGPRTWREHVHWQIFSEDSLLAGRPHGCHRKCLYRIHFFRLHKQRWCGKAATRPVFTSVCKQVPKIFHWKATGSEEKYARRSVQTSILQK